MSLHSSIDHSRISHILIRLYDLRALSLSLARACVITRRHGSSRCGGGAVRGRCSAGWTASVGSDEVFCASSSRKCCRSGYECSCRGTCTAERGGAGGSGRCATKGERAVFAWWWWPRDQRGCNGVPRGARGVRCKFACTGIRARICEYVCVAVCGDACVA